MKTKNLKRRLFIVFVISLFFSCHVEENTDNTTNQSQQQVSANNWQKADLSKFFTGKEINYPIPMKQLRQVVADFNVHQIQFIPDIVADEIVIKVRGVNAVGIKIAEVLIMPSSSRSMLSQLSDMLEVRFNKNNIKNKKVARHILEPLKAQKYINRLLRQSYLDINEVTSYNGERIRYFSLEKEVVKHMSDLSVEFISMSWGLNDENKLTTVFIPSGNDIIKSNNSRGEETMGYIYDFTAPCPTTCH